MDAVSAAAGEAAAAVRDSGRPFLLETFTYRLRGHYEPDDQAYVDPAELAAWRTKDPLARTHSRLLASGTIGVSELAALRRRVEDRIDRAVRFADESPYPDLAQLSAEVYA